MEKSGGIKIVVFRQITPYVSVIQPLILIGRFQNISSEALTESWVIGYFQCV